jgi:hypothetical protein
MKAIDGHDRRFVPYDLVERFVQRNSTAKTASGSWRPVVLEAAKSKRRARKKQRCGVCRAAFPSYLSLRAASLQPGVDVTASETFW